MESQTKLKKKIADKVSELDKQNWCRSEDSTYFTGKELAYRLIEIGARRFTHATIEELLSVPVGGYINTGISSYERVT